MTEPTVEYDHDDWLALVMRSPLDERVWCAVLPDVDQHAGTMHASTSVRRAKGYAESEARKSLTDPETRIVWVRDGDDWALVEPVSPPGRES